MVESYYPSKVRNCRKELAFAKGVNYPTNAIHTGLAEVELISTRVAKEEENRTKGGTREYTVV